MRRWIWRYTDGAVNPTAVRDVRGAHTTKADRSEHRRHHWLYEDLLA